MSAKATIVDVRTPQEFVQGHAPGSINIPLNEVPERLAEIGALPRPIVLCCRSGVRSENALGYLTRQGFTGISNGGSWQQAMQDNP